MDNEKIKNQVRWFIHDIYHKIKVADNEIVLFEEQFPGNV